MIYFLMFHGQPKLDAEDVDNVGGAYINCYVQADNLEQANKISRKDIRKMKWEILEQEDAYELDADSVSDEGREYYEQAIINKTVYVLHTYPIEEN